MKMRKDWYSMSLDPDILHFAAHSHHPRPDVTLKATERSWLDAARLFDTKWDHIFTTVIPAAQMNIALLIGTENHTHITFGQNTHELVARVLSSFRRTVPLHILTTDSEFRSFGRQLARLQENPSVAVTKIAVHPRDSFVSRLLDELKTSRYEVIFLSEVFYDTGYRLHDYEIRTIAESAKRLRTEMIIDGYHSFCAVPTTIGGMDDHVMYVGGGYKYAQYGEGACFLYTPPGCLLRPENTGWFAEFGDLAHSSGHGVEYSNDGFRFWGSTFDPAGLYRLNAVADWMNENDITIYRIRRHVLDLQARFLRNMRRLGTSSVHEDRLAVGQEMRRGNFLSYDLESEKDASAMQDRLVRHGVYVDSRGQYLRIGFGMYHDQNDVDELTRRIEACERGGM